MKVASCSVFFLTKLASQDKWKWWDPLQFTAWQKLLGRRVTGMERAWHIDGLLGHGNIMIITGDNEVLKLFLSLAIHIYFS